MSKKERYPLIAALQKFDFKNGSHFGPPPTKEVQLEALDYVLSNMPIEALKRYVWIGENTPIDKKILKSKHLTENEEADLSSAICRMIDEDFHSRLYSSPRVDKALRNIFKKMKAKLEEEKC